VGEITETHAGASGAGHDALRIRQNRITVSAWWKLAAGVGALGAEGAVSYMHPWVGVVLAVTDTVVPAIIVVGLVAVILWGGDAKCDRVFRLLRWIVDRPEPPGPALANRSARACKSARDNHLPS
jgi:hypothetical protein